MAIFGRASPLVAIPGSRGWASPWDCSWQPCCFWRRLAIWYLGQERHPRRRRRKLVAQAIAIRHGVRCTAPTTRFTRRFRRCIPLVAAGLLAAAGIGRTNVPPGWEVTSAAAPAAPGGSVIGAPPSVDPVLLGRPRGLARSCSAASCALVSITRRSRTRGRSSAPVFWPRSPQVAGPLVEFFHPEDLWPWASCWRAVAAAVRGRWLAAGALIGLACCANSIAAAGRRAPAGGGPFRWTTSDTLVGWSCAAAPCSVPVGLRPSDEQPYRPPSGAVDMPLRRAGHHRRSAGSPRRRLRWWSWHGWCPCCWLGSWPSGARQRLGPRTSEAPVPMVALVTAGPWPFAWSSRSASTGTT